jgi:hypothetical protein
MRAGLSIFFSAKALKTDFKLLMLGSNCRSSQSNCGGFVNVSRSKTKPIFQRDFALFEFQNALSRANSHDLTS